MYRMFREGAIARVKANHDLKDAHLSIEVRNVLALNDAAATTGEDRFFYFSNPNEKHYTPSVFTTKAGYGPLVIYDKYKWSEEEKAEYWKHEEPERHCLMQFELSTINLDTFVVPFLLLIPSDDQNYITWPNDTIAKAIMAIIDDEIHLGRRVEWELVALQCGRGRELFFDATMDPEVDPSELDEDHQSPYQLARNSLKAVGTNIQQCFKELLQEGITKDWVQWHAVKKVVVVQGNKNYKIEIQRVEIASDGKQAQAKVEDVPEEKESDEERMFKMDEELS